MEFEWDPKKAETNKRKHGVSFYEAEQFLGTHWPSLSLIRTILMMKIDTSLLVCQDSTRCWLHMPTVERNGGLSVRVS